MDFVLLADDLTAAPTVAQWYFDEWISSNPEVTIEQVISKVSTFTSRNGAPMIILAKEENNLIAAAELKLHEMSIYPDYTHWVGGVYVAPPERGRGIGSAIVKEVIARAVSAGISSLYLQTEVLTGGIYADVGFKPIEQVNYKGKEVLVMVAEDIGSRVSVF